MLGAALHILKYLAIAGGISLIAILFAPFMLSSRISREEEAEDYRILLEKLQRARDKVPPPETATVHHLVPPVKRPGVIVRPHFGTWL